MSEGNVAVSKDYVDDSITFDSFNLDPRLLQAINKLGFEHPTLIQAQSIKLSLQEKKDIIAKASTGSGKTAAYCIPVVQSILVGSESRTPESKNEIQSVVLVPTKELTKQVSNFLKDLTIYCGKHVKVVNLNDIENNQLLTAVLNERPEILVSTPSKLLTVLEEHTDVSLMELKYLVIDEVDLMLSYGYDEDLEKLSNFLNLKQHMQVFMMSATLNDDINSLKQKFCNKAAILKLQDLDNQNKRLLQYYVKTSEYDKFLLIYVILKLNLIKGKILIFVNNLDRGYKLKLFLQNFGLKSCILNSELPVNSRLHILEEFNKNVYNLLIATDESNEYDEEDIDDNNKDNSQDEKKSSGDNDAEGKKLGKKSGKRFTDGKDYGASRGVDFKNVACVVNFDLPTSSKAYIHRVGRTARGGKSGMALSFVVSKNEWGKHKPSSLPSARKDEKVLAKIERTQKKLGYQIEPYQFDQKQLDNFRYRMDDSFRSVTQTAVREARLREIKMELMTSEKLKRHFEENPQDLETLRHDKALSKVRFDVNLKRVPEYLLPPGARQDVKKLGFVPFTKNKKRQQGKRRSGGKKKVDVLKKYRK